MQTLKLSTGVTIEVAPVSGLKLQAMQGDVADPPVPKEYIESLDIWYEYPQDKEYIEAVQQAQTERSVLAQRYLIANAVTLVDKPDLQDYTLLKKSVQRGIVNASWADLDDPNDMQTLYIEHIAIGSREDYTRIGEAACLTESGVSKIFNTLKVTRDNTPIQDVPPKNAVYAGIQNATIAIGETLLVHPCDQYDACVASKLDWYLWVNQTYEVDFMLMTIALYRARLLKDIHGQDAAQEKRVKDSKKNKT